MTITMRDVVLAVRYGDASLVGESAGYVVLGAADLALRRLELATVDSVGLSGEGAVILEGSPCSAEDAEVGLRSLLGQLLELVRSPCPNLNRVVQRKEVRGLMGLVTELEAALVPVNRKAARRSLARLARETKRSAARERAHAAVEPVAHVEPELAPALPSPLPEPVVSINTPERVQQVIEVRSAPDASSASLGAASHMSAKVWHAVAARVGASTPSDAPHVVERSEMADSFRDDCYQEPDVFFEDDDLDEEPTRLFQGQTALQPAPPPQPSRRRARVRSRRPSVPAETSLIRRSENAPARRPSDIRDLLDRMSVAPQPADEVYLGLKSLSRVEISPVAPPVSVSWIEDDGR